MCQVLRFACIISFNPDDNPVGDRHYNCFYSLGSQNTGRSCPGLGSPARQRQCWVHAEVGAVTLTHPAPSHQRPLRGNIHGLFMCPSFPQRYEGVFIERTGIWEVPLFLWLEFGEREVVGLQARPSSQAGGRLWGAGCQVFQSF